MEICLPTCELDKESERIYFAALNLDLSLENWSFNTLCYHAIDSLGPHIHYYIVPNTQVLPQHLGKLSLLQESYMQCGLL